MKKLLLQTLVLGLFVELRAGWFNEASIVGLFTGTSIGAIYVGEPLKLSAKEDDPQATILRGPQKKLGEPLSGRQVLWGIGCTGAVLGGLCLLEGLWKGSGIPLGEGSRLEYGVATLGCFALHKYLFRKK